jgi:hypothetical protein
LQKISSVKNVILTGKNKIEISYLSTEDIREKVFDQIVKGNGKVIGMYQQKLDVESIFQKLTKNN